MYHLEHYQTSGLRSIVKSDGNIHDRYITHPAPTGSAGRGWGAAYNLDTCSQSDTKQNRVARNRNVRKLSSISKRELEFYASFDSLNEFEHAMLQLPVPVASEKPVFKTSLYRSGEMTGAYFLSGYAQKSKPPQRSGPVVTFGFSPKSAAKIRRAVECSTVPFRCMITLTFAPRQLHDWQIDHCTLADRLPVVRQDYAKYRLRNFRNALNMKSNRQIHKIMALPENSSLTVPDRNIKIDEYKFRYVWVSELQKNGNIHFHMLTNRFFSLKALRRLWPYGSVNVQPIKGDECHASAYMTKYMTKTGESMPIVGNRYNMSVSLRKDRVPSTFHAENSDAVVMRKVLKLMKDEVRSHGGRVIDSGFGFSYPRPRKEKVYFDKKQQKYFKRRGVSDRLAQSWLAEFHPAPF